MSCRWRKGSRYTDAALALAPGVQLGPYEVVTSVGAGGMGEVYRARDVRLSRVVAIKVLPAHLKDQPELRRRFLQEAQTIAALNHPHICVLHDIGSEADVDFLVMEYLEGETLAKRLEGGALPLEQVLRYSIEIGSALERAHRQGVVHRDLKPANIMVTKSGVKLLDFGLAKLRPAGVVTAPGHAAITQSAPLTGAGAILGTLPYMAPEQLEGRSVDACTDIFAFGAVMYEMATGVRPFQGNSPASLIAAILEHTPTPMCARQPLLPRTFGEIVHRCLAKNPEERWQSASDFTFTLTRVRHELLDTPGMTPAPVDARRRWSGVALASITGLLLALVGFLVGRGTLSPSLEQPPVHLLLSEQALTTLTEMGPMPALAISPDGQRIVYISEHDGVRRLYLRELQAAGATALAGTENAIAPFFSPDGRRLGYFADGYLKVIATDGGAPVVLANAGNTRGGTWANDDTIIYSPSTDAGLWQVAASGGPARQLVAPDPDKGERSYRWPVVVPGHAAVVFVLATSQILSFDDARLMVRSLTTGEQRELVRGGSFPVAVTPDLLLYSRGGALLAVPFNAARQEVTGTATTLLDGVTTYPANGGAQYALATNGTLI